MNISYVAYINLDHRKDKLENIIQQLYFCPYKTIRIPGVVITDHTKYTIENKFRNDIDSYRGVIGCFLAHKKAIKTLCDMGLDSESYCLILEDDVYIDESFWDLIKTIPDYDFADIVYFDDSTKLSHYGTFPKISMSYPIVYSINENHRPLKKTHNNKHRLCFHGAHCYAIKNKKLSKILHVLDNIKEYRNIDIFCLNTFNVIDIETGLVYQQLNTLPTDNPKPKR